MDAIRRLWAKQIGYSMAVRKRKQPLKSLETSEPEAAIPGRKLDKVLDAAWTLFTRDGFQRTSMEAIARDANVSKATLYAYFPSKQDLFGHLIAEECRRAKSAIAMPDLERGVAEALRSFAKQYTRMFIQEFPHRMPFFQILVTEGARFPELARLMIDSGPRADAERLASLLEEASRAGLLDIEDAKVAAAQFICLVRGELPLQCALGMRAVAEAEVEQTIEAGLRLFLKACEPRRSRRDDRRVVTTDVPLPYSMSKRDRPKERS